MVKEEAPAVASERAPDSSLALLLQTCSSITETALSCRTLQLSSNKKDVDSLIRKELELAEWLDRQIIDHRASAQRQRLLTKSTDESDESLRDPCIEQKWQQLMNETAKRQKEQLLLSRIEMASVARESIFPHQTNHSVRQDNEAILCREAIIARDIQVQRAIKLLNELKDIQAQLQEATNGSLILSKQNREQWQNLSSKSNNPAPGEKDSRLASENRILKRVLQDVVVGSDLDWYADPRLRETMLKLEA